MKKNVVGHMVVSKEKASSRFRRWEILPRLICLLLALLIWLAISNTARVEPDKTGEPAGTEDVAS